MAGSPLPPPCWHFCSTAAGAPLEVPLTLATLFPSSLPTPSPGTEVNASARSCSRSCAPPLPCLWVEWGRGLHAAGGHLWPAV